MANSCRLRVVRGDLQLEVEGDKKFVLEMLARFDPSGTPRVKASASMRSTKTTKQDALSPSIDKEMSPGEFIRQFQFKKHTDFVLAFGYYLEKHSGLPAFSAADINNCYYEAKMESSNTSQMIIQNIKRGYMMQAKGKIEERKGLRKLFTLTHTGEEYLQKGRNGSGEE
jgi:hypothetical protein